MASAQFAQEKKYADCNLIFSHNPWLTHFHYCCILLYLHDFLSRLKTEHKASKLYSNKSDRQIDIYCKISLGICWRFIL